MTDLCCGRSGCFSAFQCGFGERITQILTFFSVNGNLKYKMNISDIREPRSSNHRLYRVEWKSFIKVYFVPCCIPFQSDFIGYVLFLHKECKSKFAATLV